jgi:hypothetical protein
MEQNAEVNTRIIIIIIIITIIIITIILILIICYAEVNTENYIQVNQSCFCVHDKGMRGGGGMPAPILNLRTG